MGKRVVVLVVAVEVNGLGLRYTSPRRGTAAGTGRCVTVQSALPTGAGVAAAAVAAAAAAAFPSTSGR